MPREEKPPSPSDESVGSTLRRMLQGINISHLLLIIFALHLFALSFPSDTTNGAGVVFDEKYYVTASLDLLNGTANNLEHPFFGKAWGALGISIFGNNFFGWRIFYAVVGTLAVWMMYELARQFFSKEKALLAASMLAFENLFFVHTSLLLIDGPSVLFALAGFLAYFKRRYYLSALAFGLCILSKETGIFFLLALGLYHLWANAGKLKASVSPSGLKKGLAFVVIVAVVFGVPLWGYDMAYHPYTSSTVVVIPTVIVNSATGATTTTTSTRTTHSGLVTNPIQNIEYYYTYQSSLTGCGQINDWNCYPWNWILPFGVGPLPYYVTSVNTTTTTKNCSTGTCVSSAKSVVEHPIDWQGMGNLVVWYSIWLVAPISAWQLIRRRATEVQALVACIIAGTYLPLFYISLISHRVEYAFYFVNTDIALALGIPMVITVLARGNPIVITLARGKMETDQLLVLLWLIAAVAFFFAYFPVNPFAF